MKHITRITALAAIVIFTSVKINAQSNGEKKVAGVTVETAPVAKQGIPQVVAVPVVAPVKADTKSVIVVPSTVVDKSMPQPVVVAGVNIVIDSKSVVAVTPKTEIKPSVAGVEVIKELPKEKEKP